MTITTERLIEIENEREQTMNNPSFIQWMRELQVSIVYKDRSSVIKANEMNSNYDFRKLNKQSKLSRFSG